MHKLYTIRISKDEAETSGEARSQAMTTLENEGFSSQGFFGSGKADWFVVGGRWSNILTPIKKEVEAEATSLLVKNNITHDIATLRINEHLVKDDGLKQELNAIYQRAGQDFFTDTYSYLGNEGDGQKITKELLETLKGEYFDDTEVYDTVECDEYSVNKLPEEAIGDWLVVIDYHN